MRVERVVVELSEVGREIEGEEEEEGYGDMFEVALMAKTGRGLWV